MSSSEEPPPPDAQGDAKVTAEDVKATIQVIKNCKRIRSFKDEEDLPEDGVQSVCQLETEGVQPAGGPASGGKVDLHAISPCLHQSKKPKNDLNEQQEKYTKATDPVVPATSDVSTHSVPAEAKTVASLPAPAAAQAALPEVGDLSEDEDDDDDWEDDELVEGWNADFLDGAEDCDADVCDGDVMMEGDDTKSNTSSTFSTGSSVGSNTPSLVGENLESVCLGEREGPGETKEGVPKEGKKGPFCIAMGPLVPSPLRPLRRSLFSNVPPTINFVHHNEVSETPLPAEVRKHLRWKLSNITPAVVKRIVTNSGFRLMRKSCSSDWGGCWGKHMKSPMFKDLNETQKLNHLPGTFSIGRKDRLWKNYHRLRLKFGREEFSFLPRTFLLPAETKLLKRVWEKKGPRAKWIVKPPALARGNGIKVVNKWSQIPKCRPLIVQKYVSKPHLINSTKYDLRIYVLLTSLSPLRIFLYDDGLVRFASNAYSSDSNSLSDVFTHLTNYSINKNSSTYQANEDSESRSGHKWTLSSLWSHFAETGVDAKPVVDSIKDLIIKTIVSAEHSMHAVYRPNLSSHYCGYELFGFDVLLDSKLKPWLIEVNISPSLHSSSPLDLDVKSPLATEVFNLARYHIPPAKMSMKTQRDILEQLNMTSSSQLCMDRRLYARELSKSERAKQDKFLSLYNSWSGTTNGAEATATGENGGGETATASRRSLYLEQILEALTPDDVRFLIRAEDELAQAAHFTRIFPTRDTHKYFKYFETPRYYNLLFDAWETKYADDNLRAAAIDRLERHCVSKFHLRVPTILASKAGASGTPAGPAGVPGTGGAAGAARGETVGGAGGHEAAKKKVMADVSVLKGPTGASPSSAVFKTADTTTNAVQSNAGAGQLPASSHKSSQVSLEQAAAARLTPPPSSPASVNSVKVKASSVSVTAKHHSFHGKSPFARQKAILKRSSAGPSPEPMSTDDTPTTSASDKSRSPSPPGKNESSPADNAGKSLANQQQQSPVTCYIEEEKTGNFLDNQRILPPPPSSCLIETPTSPPPPSTHYPTNSSQVSTTTTQNDNHQVIQQQIQKDMT